jgi:hypothetical protein
LRAIFAFDVDLEEVLEPLVGVVRLQVVDDPEMVDVLSAL